MNKSSRLARAQADEARARLKDTTETVKTRLHPRALSQEAMGKAKQKVKALATDAGKAAKARPALTAGIATALALFVLRKPLVKIMKRAIKEKRNGQ